MQCADARLLLDQGNVPGSTSGRNPHLGFHLAGCAACRAYRDELDRSLLAALVAAPSPAPKTANLASSPAAPPAPRRRRRIRRVALLGSALAVGIALVAAWYLVLPLARAYRSLESTYRPGPPQPPLVAAAAPQLTVVIATAAPTPEPPTTTPRPTATPRPTHTPTITPTATPQPTPTPALPEARPLTIALLGIDARPGEGLMARSDALMLVRLDPTTGRAALLSMPRDMWVAILGYGENKVNAAFFFGERAQPGGGGLALSAQTLSAAFGLPVDHAVVVDFSGFRSLIDALGGITVDVPKEIYDGHFPTDDYGYTVAHFLQGQQQMDGERALMYARTRHPDSDFERIKRQQLVLLGIARRLGERGALQNLHVADQLSAALAPFVHTDMPPDLVLSLLWNMRSVEPGAVERLTVDGSMLWETTVGGAYALVPQDGVLPAMGRKLLMASP